MDRAVRDFGAACASKLAGPGEREAAIRRPIEVLLGAAGEQLGVTAVFHDEVRDTERQVRPDYGVSVGGAITGYVEIKAPGKSIDPGGLRGHDRVQWERQRDLPNLLYTNGTEWRLYRDRELVEAPVRFTGSLDSGSVTAPLAFEKLLTEFLRWKPAPITSVGALVRAVAPLTRLLRGEVLDQLAAERKAVREGKEREVQPFLGLAQDWRRMLFPQADDATFADGYAQTVTFALLLARTNSITVTEHSLHTIGEQLRAEHSLMGRALQLLTDDLARDFKVTLDLLARVVDAVDWTRVRRGRRDTYLHLYEHFLDEYDPELRKASGSYYTPVELVEQMVRLTDNVLVSRLDKPRGFAAPDVLTVDPAMGTGTYLQTVLERIARVAEAHDGPGAVAGAVSLAAERVIGFELQMGPYAVAELRAADLLASHGAAPPPGGMKLFVTNTLDDPHASDVQLGSGLQLIARARRKANAIKARANVTVVIGNPPYAELANGDGGWVENGTTGLDSKRRAPALLEDWYAPGIARFKAKLKNLYVYFWRWATWKVWESTRDQVDGDAGVICFVTTSGYLSGPAFTGMREYLRRYASEGWIIDLTPEGQTPDIPTRIFPGVRQQLAIGIFVRTADATRDKPALIHHRSLTGRREDKLAALAEVQLDDDGWRDCRTEWDAPLTPAAMSSWDTYPALDDLMPWYSPGLFPTRTWVYAPSPDVLSRRWAMLVGETDRERKAELFKEGRDANLVKVKPRLPGDDTHPNPSVPVIDEVEPAALLVRVGYRAFDRQWVLADPRLMDMPRRDLWSARVPGQVFVIEQHRKTIRSGPALVFTSLIPDFDYFKGSEGGRTLPYLHPGGTPNLAPGLLAALAERLGLEATAADVLAYIAAITAHPAFTATFTDELTTPGVRVPVTTDPALWRNAVDIGNQVLWLHTYGEAFTAAERPAGLIRFPSGDARQPLSRVPVTTVPETISYDSQRQVIAVGDGEFGPVGTDVWDYSVGGRNIIKSWFNYRKKEPAGRRGSPLDDVHVSAWEPKWTGEFIDLLTVLTRLVELEPAQAELLAAVLAGDIIHRDQLVAAGVRWPSGSTDRKPLYSLASDQQKAATNGVARLL
ncbi:type ISP restriction/modification enzyme [Micromonospora halotolerans]|uniref:site-specific DNA-methyltransferase (adenine-specific) n=1 Tax=Micromonospora halotolerans TaxID=709879 RepID=A0ABZ0A3J0_9ACTN|nr:type ISP restriction/modification enzyme [Micromonospora halotolerans]WNM42148.1 type ISP restriction/modification enzyme [Micromonospora halotolerans]